MDRNGIRILCALSVLGQPRNSKRIKMLMDNDIYVEAVSFTRKYHKGRLPDCSLEILGEIEHGRFFKRILKMLKKLPRLRSIIKQYDVIYAFGLDMALLCVCSVIGLRKKVVIEIGDIRSIQVERKSFKGKLVRILDKCVVNRCKLLVATSDKFVEEYYNKWLRIYPKTLILENKLEKAEQDFTLKEGFLEKGKLTIGYFGLLRCKKTLEVLHNLTDLYPKDIRIFIAGYPTVRDRSFEELVDKKNVEYFGEYKSPQDLKKIYIKVDLVWGVYPFPTANELNWRWARTNRFYESCYFKKPIVALEGSADGFVVKQHGIGMTVENTNEDKIARSIFEAAAENFDQWQQNIRKLPEEVYLYTEENELLRDTVFQIMKD